MILEITEFIIYSTLIVIIAKYILVKTLRKLAENLNLKPKTVGNIAGYATSLPEFLTVSVSSINGLIGTGMFNILSSNIINFIQYMTSIIINKNRKALNNQAIKIPIILVLKNIEITLNLIPILLIIYILFYYLNNNAHKLYLEKEEKIIEKEIENEGKKEKGNTRKTLLYTFIILLSGILLFLISELLGNTLNNLCNKFNIPEIIVGILLGFITSIPELITFFESQKINQNQKNNKIIGVIEATNNLLTSNMLNLCIIQSIGTIIYIMYK